jgi:hypothetical protein
MTRQRIRRPQRQASEQYFTAAQLFAQRLRQVIVRPHAAQVFAGRLRLLPLKSDFGRLRAAVEGFIESGRPVVLFGGMSRV